MDKKDLQRGKSPAESFLIRTYRFTTSELCRETGDVSRRYLQSMSCWFVSAGIWVEPRVINTYSSLSGRICVFLFYRKGECLCQINK